MPRILGEQSSFDSDIPTPVEGDKNYASTIDSSLQKLANRTKWLKDNQLVGPQGPAGVAGPQGPQGVQGPAGADGADGIDGFSTINGLTNPGGSITIQAGDNISITDNGSDTITINASISASSESYYINENPTTAALGGVAAGTTFPASSQYTFQQVLDMLLYPYQAPSFSSFSISSLGGLSASGNTLEVGDSISSNRTFTWSTTNSSNVNSNSVSIIDQTGSDTVIANGLANDGSESTTYSAINKITATSHIFRIQAVNTQSTTFSSTYTVNWRHRRWWGTSANVSLSSGDILTLANDEFSTSRSKAFTIDGGGEYIYYAYPASWGTATFTVNGFLNTAWTLEVVSHTNASGHTENYNVYRTNTIQNGTGIQIAIS